MEEIKLEDLPSRAFYGLKSVGINTVEDLCGITEDDIIKIKSIGRKSLEEIIQFMKENGLSFKEKER